MKVLINSSEKFSVKYNQLSKLKLNHNKDNKNSEDFDFKNLIGLNFIVEEK